MKYNYSLFVLLVFYCSHSSGCGVTGGYYKPSWKFRVNDIKRPCAFSTLFYRAAVLKDGHVDFLNVLFDKVDYEAFNAIPKKCPHLKTVIVINGDGMWPSILKDISKIKRFAQNATDHMTTYGFKGIQIAWTHTTLTLGRNDNLSVMLKELRDMMDEKQEGSLLSVAINVREESLATSDVKEISKYVDLVFPVVENDSSNNRTVLYSHLKGPSSVDETISNWLEAGVPSEKLGIYVPLAASVYTLLDEDDNGIGALVKGSGKPKRLSFTQVQSELSSNDKCEFHFAEKQAGSYVTCGNQWVGVDDQISIRAKALYSCSKSLGGLLIGDLVDDDPLGDTGFPSPLSAIAQTTFIQYSQFQKPILNDKSHIQKVDL